MIVLGREIKGPFRVTLIAETEDLPKTAEVVLEPTPPFMIRRVLKDSRAKNQVECLGRGQNAQWRKTSKWQLGNTQ